MNTPGTEKTSNSDRVAVVIPVFNDWDSLSLLLPALDGAIGSRGWTGDVVLVDDGSVVPITEAMRTQTYMHLHNVEVLRLLRNLGHQRAIAVGLTHLYQTRSGLRAVVVMDGDGEDKPEDVPLLVEELARHGDSCIVFGARTKRLEHWGFQLMYRLYRLLHWLLTGVSVRIGNFSALPPSALPHLVVISELWNHYAAAVFRSRMPLRTLPLARGKRYCGKSWMNFSSLILHGLSAISVFSDIVGVRLLMATVMLMLLAGALVGVVLGVRFMTPLAIPGWATYAAGLLVVVLVQSLLLMLVSAFVILSMRSHVNVIPLRDAPVFIGSVETLGVPYGVEAMRMPYAT
jgi:polyisoprenyl-phosphate glycosyltransferase